MERDITWTLEMNKRVAQDQRLNQFIKGKKRALEAAGRLGDMLPVYCASLPYNQRLCASARASSLGISMQLSGIKELTYHEAKALLEHHQ